MEAADGVRSDGRWEMGSEFHLMSSDAEPSTPRAALPFSGVLHVSGRAALQSALAGQDVSGTCWLPEYICPDVKVVVEAVSRVRFYADYPDSPAPDFSTLQSEQGDTVVIQDTFGLGSLDDWSDWAGQHPEVRLVEDITHHCTQERYLQSPAHSVFASLRKTLPVADGGIVFDQSGALRRAAGGGANNGSLLKLQAMALKADYLRNAAVSKESFRDLQIAGEEELSHAFNGPCLAHTEQVLKSLPLDELRDRWEANNRRLKTRLAPLIDRGAVQVLEPRAPTRRLFNLVLKCPTPELRDRLRAFLIEHGVFPAVHWATTERGPKRAALLSQLLITVPTDFRYDEEDIDMLSEFIVQGVAS